MAWSIFKSLLISLVIGVLPSSVWACSVCFASRGASLQAYYGTAVLLSLLPLAMFGGLFFWIYRRHRNPPR